MHRGSGPPQHGGARLRSLGKSPALSAGRLGGDTSRLDGKGLALINNRQGGRRRGRGGQRPQGLSGRPDGNRQDNRQRGNAAQLLEKYKNLARDAQLAGDRVQTEYYLQFADHYFRVLGESRARYEEQRRQRGESDELDEDESDEDMVEAEADSDDRPSQRQHQRRDRAPRGPRIEANDRDDEPAPQVAEIARRQPAGDAEERIAFEVVPPSIGLSPDGEEDAEAESARPRRRTRRPRIQDSDEDIAPAA